VAKEGRISLFGRGTRNSFGQGCGMAIRQAGALRQLQTSTADLKKTSNLLIFLI